MCSEYYLIVLVITLARIFISSDKRHIYEICFHSLFQLLSQCINKEFQWKHLHNRGIIGVTVDMDGKQMSGKLYYIVKALLIY